VRDTRQSQAAAERGFTEERMAEAQEELRAAENELQRFLQNNRQFQNSPELVFQHDRLQRRVAMRQQVYTSLVQSYEQARIDEVPNTPVITVVEYAEELREFSVVWEETKDDVRRMVRRIRPSS